MAKRKTDEELLQELGLYNHLESARRFLQLMEENARLKERKPQRQDALNDQLRDLVVLANHNGMYDAADFITSLLKGKENG
jgi:hypothetical protein